MSPSSQQPAPHTSHSPQPRKAMRCFHRDLMIKRTLQFQLGLLYASEPLAGFMQQGGIARSSLLGPSSLQARTHGHAHTHINTNTHTDTYPRTHAHTHACTYPLIHERMQVRTQGHWHARMHAHMRACARTLEPYAQGGWGWVNPEICDLPISRSRGWSSLKLSANPRQGFSRHLKQVAVTWSMTRLRDMCTRE